MTDLPTQVDPDACAETCPDTCAREAAAAIDAVLDRRSPDMKAAFWTAVDKLYRLDAPPAGQPAAAPTPDVRPLAEARPGSP